MRSEDKTKTMPLKYLHSSLSTLHSAICRSLHTPLSKLQTAVKKRPVITAFILYAVILIILDYAGFFAPERQSALYFVADASKAVSIEGRVITNPEITKNGKRFTLRARKINGVDVRENVLVNSPEGYEISYGDIVEIEGMLRRPLKAELPLVFDYARYLSRNNIYTILNVSHLEYIESRPNPVKKAAFALQRDVSKKIDAYFQKSHADVLKPIIIGDESALTNEIKNDFSNAGVMHILVVSGFNVGIIGAVFMFVLKAFGIPLNKASLLCIPAVFMYAFATGANPPVMRSAIMFSSIFIALALDREPLIYNSIALSALIILIFQPQQLFTASFQMSYAATIGIIYFYNDIYGIFSNVKNKVSKFMCGVFSATFSAQIPIIPVSVYYFGKVSLISYVSNLFIVPLVSVILVLGVVFYFFTFISSFAAAGIAAVVSILMHIMIFLTQAFSRTKFAYFSVPKPDLLQLVFFFAAVFTMTYFKDKRRFIITGAIIFLNFCYLAFPVLLDRDKVFFNVYDGRNVTVTQTRRGSNNVFHLYNKRKFYDKMFASSFAQFLSFSGIKKAEIHSAGFDIEKLRSDLKNDNYELQITNYE
ncbi:MAG: ComEC family competence protein [Endomicrobia bacterium]|nr:ComEC family competence protein [Endomicrobiia bacterium]